MEEVETYKLEDASYQYLIWKNGTELGEKLTIAQSEKFSFKDTLEVACDVPNDTWYFEIEPKAGWVPQSQIAFGILIAALVSGVLTVGYWQYEMQRYKRHCMRKRSNGQQNGRKKQVKPKQDFSLT